MGVYRALSLQELLSKEILSRYLENIKNIEINLIDTSGLSGSKMYKIELSSDTDKQKLFLKVNNLKEDWLAKVSNDKGRELIIFKESIYLKIEEFIKDVYIAYYIGNESYAILMNDMSDYIGSKNNMDEYFYYLDNLAKFHSKFIEYDLILYNELLSVDEYYDFLSISKVGQVKDLKEESERGWNNVKSVLGEKLYEKYNRINSYSTIEKLYPHYPKTFVHGDYRPDNTVYLDNNNIRLIDFANCGCGPCTLDLFWYIISSVDVKIDKIELIYFYKERLEQYLGYKYTKKTWNTLLEIGVICVCRMFLAYLMSNINEDNLDDEMNVQWWVENLKFILNNR